MPRCVRAWGGGCLCLGGAEISRPLSIRLLVYPLPSLFFKNLPPFHHQEVGEAAAKAELGLLLAEARRCVVDTFDRRAGVAELFGAPGASRDPRTLEAEKLLEGIVEASSGAMLAAQQNIGERLRILQLGENGHDDDYKAPPARRKEYCNPTLVFAHDTAKD